MNAATKEDTAMNGEVEVYRPQQARITLPARIAYARELANSGLLPTAYRRNPANVLWAMEYGDMLGLSPMAAITGVHVIEGKPTASAGLISALVRRAGHRLRVRGDSQSATCQITRSDDPSYTFEVTWTLRRNSEGHPSADEAGLLGKNVWKNYPASMLKSRVITQCARDACEEALFGLHYTPEELGAEVDEDGEIVAETITETAPAANTAEPPCETSTEDDPWIVRDAPEDWADKAIGQIPTLTDVETARALYKEAVAKRDAGEITDAQKRRVCALIEARIKELADTPVEGAVAAPDGDPWQSEIDAMSTREDALPLLDKLEKARGSAVDERRYKGLKAAIRTKANSLPSAPEATE